jgi:hypothetical protein
MPGSIVMTMRGSIAARQAQVRMPGGLSIVPPDRRAGNRRRRAPAGRSGGPGRAGKNTLEHTRFDRAVRAHADEILLAQDAGEDAMRVHVQFRVRLSGAHLGDEAALRRVDRVDQGLELRRAVGRVGARDVAGVAVEAGAGVDQE